jgi:signal transduction histidine kinase/ligand-binding sensor domain-containing protein
MKTWAVLWMIAISLTGLTGCSRATAGFTAARATATPVQTPSGNSIEPAAAYGEPASTIHFTHLGIESGLSQSTINCIFQDRQGFMWFGTQDGLDRYDGYHFTIYRPDSTDAGSLSDRWITSIFQDRQGSIWVGTRLGGIDRFDPATGKFSRYMHTPENDRSISSNYVTAILEDKAGLLWVGTEEGLDQYLPGQDSFRHFDLNLLGGMADLSVPVTAIFEDAHGDLWVGTSILGIIRYDRQQGRFVSNRTLSGEHIELGSNDIHAIQPAGANALWVATETGLALVDPAAGVVARYHNNPADPNSLAGNAIQTLYVDRSGNLWVGSNAGLDRFQPGTGHFIHYQHNSNVGSSLSNNIVTAVYESNDNVIWVGTFGGELNKYYRAQDRFSNYSEQPGNPAGLSGNMIFKIHVDADQKAWLSVYGSGVDCLDPHTGTVTHLRNDPADPGSLSDNEVWSVYLDREGTLWVGTSTGLDRREAGSKDFIHYRYDPDPNMFLRVLPGQSSSESPVVAPVYDILEDGQGNLWFGTAAGLGFYKRKTDTFTLFQHNLQASNNLGGNEIVNLFMDSEGAIWTGSFNDGLDRLDPGSGVFTTFRHDPQLPDSLSNDSILSILQDSRGILWIGTAGGGLNRYDPETGAFAHFFESDGLPSNVINGIVEDRMGALWLSTNNGLSHFDPLKGTFRNYNVQDGLQSNEFNMNAYARASDGSLYFGGVNGLTVFHPEAITDSAFTPPVELVSVTRNGIPLEIKGDAEGRAEIDLRWPNNYFEFEFAALSYADPGRNQYAYRLEAFDPGWNEIGTLRNGRYTNLPGGTYTLRLKGSNQDGVWNEVGAAIKVVVIPPFWQTPWFIFLAVVGMAGMVVGGYWLRLKGIRENNRQLERQVSERTREIERLFEKTKELAVVEERNRLARELHDSAKQKAFAALAQLGTVNGIVASNPKAAKNHLDEAENLVYEVIEELTFLIQEMYPLALKEKGLAVSLREYIFEWESRSDIRVDLHIEDEKQLKLETEQAVYRIIQEALSNVARHSHATHVDVTLSYDDASSIDAIVADNGCGFDIQTRPAGIGLRSIRERAESLGGIVQIESGPGCGTRLTAHIPLESKQMPGKGERHVQPDYHYPGG